MMRSIFSTLALLCSILGAQAALTEPKAQFVVADDEILLKLDYATYRGYYNTTNEVI